jgi:hypothetical protein
MCRRLGLGHWNQVSFLAIADFASGSAGSDGSRMTQGGPPACLAEIQWRFAGDQLMPSE